MQISINTAEPLSELDREILAILTGGVSPTTRPSKVAEAPAAKPAAKPKAKAKPEPEPEPEPEPMAEEPLPDEPEDDGDEEEQSDEDMLALAVKKATDMVGSGEAAKVREALDAAGASRVRELNKDNVREFFKALS